MRKLNWKKWALTFASGSFLFQTAGCVETAATVTAISSALTAAGVFYLVSRVFE